MNTDPFDNIFGPAAASGSPARRSATWPSCADG
jgi:hypothetical protein